MNCTGSNGYWFVIGSDMPGKLLSTHLVSAHWLLILYLSVMEWKLLFYNKPWLLLRLIPGPGLESKSLLQRQSITNSSKNKGKWDIFITPSKSEGKPQKRWKKEWEKPVRLSEVLKLKWSNFSEMYKDLKVYVHCYQ